MAKQPRVWTGTQWDTLAVTLPDLSNYSTTTQMNTAIDNAKGMVLLNSTTIGSAVTSVEVTNIFSSTYDNYKIIVNGGTSTVGQDIYIQLGTGSPLTAATTAYYSIRTGWRYANSAGNFVDSNNGSSMICGVADTYSINVNADLFNPFLSKYSYLNANYPGPTISAHITGYHATASSYTGFKLFPGSGSWTGGTIRVYGYRNS